MNPVIECVDESESAFLYSRNHPQIRRLRDLQTPEGRLASGEFLIEGVRPLAEAVKLGVRIEKLIVVPKLLEGRPAERLVKQLRIKGVPCLGMLPEVYYSFSQAEEPQGVAAIVRQRWEALETIRPAQGLCWVVAEAVQSPGNLGTIIRTCEAVGGAGLILLGNGADPYDPATVRASMGALFGIRFVRSTAVLFAEWKARRQVTLVGTSPSAHHDYHGVEYPRPSMILVGCEKRGMTAEVMALCDLQVNIPMVGRSDSLNVGVATSLMLYELFNQRRRQSGANRTGKEIVEPLRNSFTTLDHDDSEQRE
jgi:TrmH family RNA methyltransferase